MAFPLNEGVEECLVLLCIDFVILEDVSKTLLLSLKLSRSRVSNSLLLLHLLHEFLKNLFYIKVLNGLYHKGKKLSSEKASEVMCAYLPSFFVKKILSSPFSLSPRTSDFTNLMGA